MSEDKQVIKPVVQPEIMLEVLKEVVLVFDKYIGNYWIDSGTLLGIIRENRFLSS